MKTGGVITLRMFGFAAAGIILLALLQLGSFLLRPPSSVKEFREVLIPSGASYRSVAEELKEQGVITNVDMFVALGKLMGVTKNIRAGFYSFNTAMRPTEVIDYLAGGRIIEFQVVLPEGITMMKTAAILAEAGLADNAEFMSYATDPVFIRSLGIQADTIEGYLFPATYYFPKGITVEGIIRRLVSKYHDVFGEDLKARAAELGMSEHQVITLASLIEREAMMDKERLLISAVFHNRLRVGMRLQCDPTIIYSLEQKGRWNGILTKADLRRDDPYNTYTRTGLPPGPIANPGKPSIIAALYPADVGYIFFVSKTDGTHFFSNTLEEHNEAVQEYIRLMRDKKEAEELAAAQQAEADELAAQTPDATAAAQAEAAPATPPAPAQSVKRR